MKGIKKLAGLLMVVVGIIVTSMVAFATESSWKDSPGCTAGVISNRSAATRCYIDAKTAKGVYAYAKFGYFATLQSSFASSTKSNQRQLSIMLYDLDETGGDDLIKKYVGTFNGRTISEIHVSNSYIDGDIEAAGDNGAELYIETYVQKITGDPSNPYISSGLFQFKVGMK